jgi:hypothetical protein
VRAAPNGPRGAVNPLSVLIILAIAVAIYCVAIFSGAYLDNVDVTDAVVSAYNQTGQIPDQQIIDGIKGKLARIGTHRELNENGELVEVLGLGVTDEDVIYEINPDNTVTVTVRYVREVRLKPTGKWTKLRFAPTKRGTPAGLK